VRPDAPLASDRSIDSVWISDAHPSGAHSIVLIWKSGVVETIERWRCNCQAETSLREMGHEKPFRFLMLRGAPAVTDQSFPGQAAAGLFGPIPEAEEKYGRPATVETLRDGYNITLWQYGAHTQAGLLAAARTLSVAHAGFQVRGYDAGGAALGDWNGPHGIDVAYTSLVVTVALTFVGMPFVVRTLQPVLEHLEREVEEAAATLGAGRLRTFVTVIAPTLLPSILTGFALAFARAIGEYGSVVFISSNQRGGEIAPFLIMVRLESYDYTGAIALSVVLLVFSFILLGIINLLEQWASHFQS